MDEVFEKLKKCYDDISNWAKRNLEIAYFSDNERFAFEGGWVRVNKEDEEILEVSFGGDPVPISAKVLKLNKNDYDTNVLNIYVKLLIAWPSLKERLLRVQNEEKDKKNRFLNIINNFEV